MATINLEKHIWEGWRVIDFITELEMPIRMIMNNESWKKPFKDREELKKFCMDNQPYHKKYIKGVVDYFAKKYNIK